MGEGLSTLLSELKSGNVKRQSIKRANKPLELGNQETQSSMSTIEPSSKPKLSGGIKLPGFFSSDQIKLKSVKKL